MKILVLGGSYFLGRVFTMLASEKYEMTLFNRGTYSMDDFSVRQLLGDRSDAHALQQIRQGEYDVVVDFCAYESRHVQTLFSVLPASVKQYILISTVDVYQRGTGKIHPEDFPYELRISEGDAGAYIHGKIAAEKECISQCQKRGIMDTILRPAILYGPYNYAPRESFFIRSVVQNHQLPEIMGTDGKFQFLYVKDAALAIEQCLLNPSVYHSAVNLAGDEILTYQVFTDALERAINEEGSLQYQKIPVSVEKAMELGIPLPFPVYGSETELCDTGFSRMVLGISYTPLIEGMQKTYAAFKSVYESVEDSAQNK